jgi:anti-sigma factor RsiW
MTCELVRTNLSAFIDEALPEKEMREIYSHLEDCASCDEIYAELRAADRFFGAGAEKEVPADYRESLRERLTELAAKK